MLIKTVLVLQATITYSEARESQNENIKINKYNHDIIYHRIPDQKNRQINLTERDVLQQCFKCLICLN